MIAHGHLFDEELQRLKERAIEEGKRAGIIVEEA